MKSSLGTAGHRIAWHQRASLLVSTAIAVLLGSGVAAYAGPPALPGSALQGIQTEENTYPEAGLPKAAEPAAPTVAAPEVEVAQPTEAQPEAAQPEAAQPKAAQPQVAVPAERAAADDESARLASEVPAEDVAIPAAEWLNQEVGSIATRPVDESATQAEPIAEDKPAEASEPVREMETTVVETAPVHKPVDMEIGDPMIPAAEAKSQAAGDKQPPAAPVEQAAAAQAAQAESVEQPVVRIESPKIVTIEADFSNKDDSFEMKGPAALDAGAATGGKFALVWIDGSQRSGDTFVKFWKPSRQFFESGNECLTWARDEAAEGRAISPEGIQPGRQALQAGCFARDGSREYWVWRQASGAFTKTQLSATQFALFEEVARQWSVSSALAYGEFPVAPYAGQ